MYKGIILAGGQGTRLYPSSLVVSKQLLNVYDKPLIYYPISTLMLAGIKDILVISAPEYMNQFVELLGDGSQWGINISYDVQYEPKGIADAFLIAEEFIGDSKVCLILGDNIFYGHELTKLLTSCRKNNGATVLSYEVTDPQRFGVVQFNKHKKVTSLEEKPKNPKSNSAVVGLYFYDNKVVEYAKKVVKSARGELEITDINRMYLEKGNLNVVPLCRGMTWIDAGTFDSLLMASNFICTIEKMQGKKISCLEEIAYRKKWISKDHLLKLSDVLHKSGYGAYLKSIAEEDI